jgi:hypothetical protein
METRDANYMDLFPQYGSDCVIWSGLFLALYYLMPMITQSLYPVMYAGQSFPPSLPLSHHPPGFTDKKKLDFNSYICSFVHHIVVVPIAFYRIFSNSTDITKIAFSIYSRFNPLAISSNSLNLFHCDAAPFSFGYLLSDTLLYAVPEALRGNREYLYHHTLGLCLFLAVPYLTPDIAPYCGRVLIMESTSIFFTTAYLLRNGGYGNSFLVPLLEASFAIDFFLVRVLNGFDLFYHIIHDVAFVKHEDPIKGLLGKGLAILFVPILAMQVYWMVIIVKKSMSRYDGRNKKVE